LGNPEEKRPEKSWQKERDPEKVGKSEGKTSVESWQGGGNIRRKFASPRERDPEKEIRRKLAIWRKREPPKLGNPEKLEISRVP
jgi:hypothetical protein